MVQEMKKVLLVTNDKLDVKAIKKILENKKYEIYEAQNNRQALKIAEDEVPDIILVDFLSKNIDGLEFCEELRKNRNTYLIPVIFLSEDGKHFKKIESYRAGADDFIIKPYNSVELEVRIENLLKRLHLSRACNPLTGLPGNVSIEWEINKRLRGKEKFAVCYIDMDNFKAYNDKYGYELGDNIIKFLGRIIVDSVSVYGGRNDFIGHIGGDDFILITTVEKLKNVLNDIIMEFDGQIINWYNNEDRKRRYIEIPSRQGLFQRFKIMTLSIGVAHNEARDLYSLVQISEIATELKGFAKRRNLDNPKNVSSFAIDRRKE